MYLYKFYTNGLNYLVIKTTIHKKYSLALQLWPFSLVEVAWPFLKVANFTLCLVNIFFIFMLQWKET